MSAPAIQCPACHRATPPGSKFCLECGTRLPVVCSACGRVLPDEAKFCIECGAPVLLAASKPASEPPSLRSPASYTPRHLADRILASRSALEGERKPVTVLFCDVVSSTALVERLGPEGMHALLGRFFQLALAEVHRYEGTINQFLGDGFMALFGAPLAHEDHARRAVLAALDIRRAVGEGLDGVELRMGLNTGFVVVGAIGDNLRMDYTAVGDTTHLAARLQQLAEPGTIVVSEATARSVRGYVKLESRGPVTVRGHSVPVDISVVLGPGSRRSALDATDERPLSQFVGRGREIDLLRERLEEAEAGRGQVVGLVGEPGVGKSRLLLEFRRSLGDAGRFIEARCLSFGGAMPYLPLLDIVRAVCGVTDSDPPDTVQEAVSRALTTLQIDLAARPLIVSLLGVHDRSGAVSGLAPEGIKTLTFEALRQLILRTSRRRSLVLAIEDAQWMDGTSEEFLASLVEAMAGARLLLLGTYRPGYRPPWTDKSYATQLPLTRLTATDSLTVVRSVLPEAGLADPMARLILDKAEGNPFFIEELARAMAGTGQPSGLVVPDTVHGVLAARIDRLADAPKRLLQMASILGREFPVRLLQALWGAEPLAPLLHELTRQEFLYERSGVEEPTYVFKHALTQDVAESTILNQRRREFHFRAAEALAALHVERAADIAPVLARHYFQAEAWALACEHASRAAEAASAAYANREALEQYDRALAAAERGGLPGTDRMRLLAARGRVHGRVGAFEAACADLETAVALAREADDRRACAELLGALGELWGGHRDYQRGRALTREAVTIAERAGDHRGLAEALVQTGLMELNLGHMADGEQALERALEIFQALGDVAGSARTLDVLSMAAGLGGKTGRSVERGREALGLYERLDHRVAAASIRTNIGIWLAYAGRRAEAETLISAGLETAVAVGARSDEAYAHIVFAQLHNAYGDFAGALRDATAALDIARQIRHREWMAGALLSLGMTRRDCGDAGGARRLHEEMLEITRELGNAIWTAEGLGELGQDFLMLGDLAAAERAFDEAVRGAGDMGYAVARSLVGQGDLLLACGRPEAARARARDATLVAAELRPWGLEGSRIEGEAIAALGGFAEAARALTRVQAEARAIGADPVWWRSTLALADALTALGRTSEATAQRAEARAVLERVAAALPDDLRATFAGTSAMRRAVEP